mgnify:CR=1 FL=1|jgi:hypothetical protein|tara:strand:- start:1795 stop:2058 length:264 start_codon:yes stop_codon:yes gene_type:complete
MNTMKLTTEEVKLLSKVFQLSLHYLESTLHDEHLAKQIMALKDKYEAMHQERPEAPTGEAGSTPIGALGMADSYYKEVAVGEVFGGE